MLQLQCGRVTQQHRSFNFIGELTHVPRKSIAPQRIRCRASMASWEMPRILGRRKWAATVMPITLEFVRKLVDEGRVHVLVMVDNFGFMR